MEKVKYKNLERLESWGKGKSEKNDREGRVNKEGDKRKPRSIKRFCYLLT